MKERILISCIINAIMSLTMNITVNILNHTLNVSFFSFRTLIMLVLGFAIGEALSFIVPIVEKRQNKNRIVTSCLIGALNTTVISFVMTWINIRVLPIVIQVFVNTWVPLFLVSTIVAIVIEPILIKIIIKKS